MKTKNNSIAQRLKETVSKKSGCSVLYLKVLKSDLTKILKEYMKFSDLDIDVAECGENYQMNISVKISEFFDIGRGN